MTEPGAGSAHAASTSAPTQSGRKVTSLEKKSDIIRISPKDMAWENVWSNKIDGRPFGVGEDREE